MVLELKLRIGQKNVKIPLENGIEISRPILRSGNVNAYFVDPVQFRTYTKNDFLANTQYGSSVNCEYFSLNAHGQSTHIECYGHISKRPLHLNKALPKTHYLVELVDVVFGKDGKLTLPKISSKVEGVIGRFYHDREVPQMFSGQNAPSFSPQVFQQHQWSIFVTDLPSVDPEKDDGQLLAHKAFWWNENKRNTQFISELAKIPMELQPGFYILAVQSLAIESDASPARLIVYPINDV